jgi:hypothetical protein
LTQFERSLTQERVWAGLTAARRRDGVVVRWRLSSRRSKKGDKCRALPDLWHQAEHAHRFLSADRLVCRCETSAERNDATTIDRGPDSRPVARCFAPRRRAVRWITRSWSRVETLARNGTLISWEIRLTSCLDPEPARTIGPWTFIATQFCD